MRNNAYIKDVRMHSFCQFTIQMLQTLSDVKRAKSVGGLVMTYRFAVGFSGPVLEASRNRYRPIHKIPLAFRAYANSSP